MTDKIGLNNSQINTVIEIFADGQVSNEEKKKAEKAGISYELMTELQGMTTNEVNDLMNKFLENNAKEQENNEILPKLSAGAAGGFLGLLVGKNKYLKVAGLVLGAFAGLAVGEILSKWFLKSQQKQEKIPITHDLVDCKANIIPAHTDTLQQGDNLSTIGRKNNVSVTRMRKANPNVKDENKMQIGDVVNVPASYNIKGLDVQTNMKSVSQLSGVSEIYLSDIIKGLECQNKNPELKAYYDDVKDAGHSKGHLTIGFGHTGYVNGKKITESTVITKQEAYKILANDVLGARAEAISFLGEDLLNAPQSIQDAIIDIAFNKGSEKVFDGIERDSDGKILSRDFQSETRNLAKDIANKDYVSAAKHVIYNTENLGLKKRNIYRVITATRDLSPQDRKAVLDSVKEYYLTVKKEFAQKKYHTDVRMMEKAWQEAYNGNCGNFFN